MEYMNESNLIWKKMYDFGDLFQLQIIFFVKNTLYNFNQNIDNENFYMAEEHVWYDVGCPSKNGIVNLVILVLLIIICFPTLSISLLLCREIYQFKHQGWRCSSSNEEIVESFIKNSLFLTLIEKINSWRKLHYIGVLYYSVPYKYAGLMYSKTKSLTFKG